MFVQRHDSTHYSQQKARLKRKLSALALPDFQQVILAGLAVYQSILEFMLNDGYELKALFGGD